jgi:hypothetical protein
MKKFSEWIGDKVENVNEGKMPQGPFGITKERAEEIRRLGTKYKNWSEVCTPEEEEEITRIYNQMSDDHAWIDALNLIRGRKM